MNAPSGYQTVDEYSSEILRLALDEAAVSATPFFRKLNDSLRARLVEMRGAYNRCEKDGYNDSELIQLASKISSPLIKELVRIRLESGERKAIVVDPSDGHLFELGTDTWRRSDAADHIENKTAPLPLSTKYVGQLFIAQISHGTSTQQNKVEGGNEKSSGGRPPKDWPSFLIEVICIANSPDGLPDKQSELETTMLAWCEREWGGAGESTVRSMVSRIYQAARSRPKT